MPTKARPAPDQLNELVLKLFRLNGRLLNAADSLTEGSGLTAARWQVLGAVLHEPLTVAAVARNMGLARQSVQRLADLLVAEGLCAFLPNPAHQRAKLLAPTEHGWKAIDRIRPGVRAWSKQITALVGKDTIASASVTVDALLQALASVEGQEQLPAPARSARSRRIKNRDKLHGET